MIRRAVAAVLLVAVAATGPAVIIHESLDHVHVTYLDAER